MAKRAWKVRPELIDRFLDVLADNGFKWMSGHRANELKPMRKNVTLLFIKEKPKTLIYMRYWYYQIKSDKEYNIIEVTEELLDEMEDEGVTEFSATKIKDREDEKQGECELNKMGRFLYVVYDWTDRDIKTVSYNKDKAYAKVGADCLEGENTKDYHMLVIDLEYKDLLRELKETETK